MRKIHALVISASLPPFNDSSTLHLIGRVQQFPKHAIEATFVGAAMPKGVENALLRRLPANSTILRTGMTAYDRIMDWLSRLPGAKLLTWVYANAMYRIAAPDVRAGWDRQVVHLCVRLLASLKPDIIVTHSGSYTAHIAGRRLAQLFSVPWIADLGDPWSLVDSDSWIYAAKARRNRVLELRTIPYASGVVFTTEETLAAYRAWLSEKLPRAIVLPAYGYNESDFLAVHSEAQLFNPQISLSHIGTAHQGNRNLTPLIQALGALEQAGVLNRDYTLNIIGPHSQSFEEEAKRMQLRSACFLGRVSYQESVDWINRSSVLLIVGNVSTLQIPAKVYPYLGSGRPILYIGQLPHEQDPTARLLEKFSGILFAQNNRDSISSVLQQIDRCYEELWREAMKRLDMPSLHEYKASVVGDRFAEFIRAIAIESAATKP